MDSEISRTKTIRVEKLTARRCAQVGVGDVVPDPATPGLYLRGGKRGPAWIFKYRSPTRVGAGGRPEQRAMGLGSLNDLPLDRARMQAAQLRLMVLQKRDPLDERDARQAAERAAIAKAAAETLDSALARYYDEKIRKTYRRPNQPIHLLMRVADERLDGTPLGRRPVVDIKRKDVLRVYAQMQRHGPILANRAIQALGAFYSWSRDHVDGMDEQVLPTMKFRPAVPEEPRRRSLSDEELRAVWLGTDALELRPRAWLRLLILTGLRGIELNGLRWTPSESQRHGHYDSKAGELIFPGRSVKNGVEFIVPLPVVARELLLTLPRVASSPFIFSASGVNPANCRSSWKEQLDKLVPIAPWRLHDLRRTFSSGHQKIGTSPELRSRLMNHVSGGIRKVYDRYDFLPEKRAALEAWAQRISSIVDPERRAAA